MRRTVLLPALARRSNPAAWAAPLTNRVSAEMVHNSAAKPLILGFGAGQAHHPGFGFIGDLEFTRTVVLVFQARLHARRQRLVDAAIDHRPTEPKLALQISQLVLLSGFLSGGRQRFAEPRSFLRQNRARRGVEVGLGRRVRVRATCAH